MSKSGISAAALSAVTVIGLALAPAAMAEERTCRGTIGGTTVDNLSVPQGASCTLNGTNVKGTGDGAAQRDAPRPRCARRRQRPG